VEALLYDRGQGRKIETHGSRFTAQICFEPSIRSRPVEVNGASAAFRQIDEQGRVVDSFHRYKIEARYVRISAQLELA